MTEMPASAMKSAFVTRMESDADVVMVELFGLFVAY